MIYSEEIENEPLYASFRRQKNEKDGDWYGFMFLYKDQHGEEQLCDNDDWVVNTLIPLVIEKQHKTLRAELNVDWDKKDFKLLRKLVGEVLSGGW